jgi:hypothetical protein
MLKRPTTRLTSRLISPRGYLFGFTSPCHLVMLQSDYCQPTTQSHQSPSSSTICSWLPSRMTSGPMSAPTGQCFLPKLDHLGLTVPPRLHYHQHCPVCSQLCADGREVLSVRFNFSSPRRVGRLGVREGKECSSSSKEYSGTTDQKALHTDQ